MLGLSAYQSSSEDELDNKPTPPKVKDAKTPAVETAQHFEPEAPTISSTHPSVTSCPKNNESVIGPAKPQDAQSPLMEETLLDERQLSSSPDRSLIQNLTLPPIPNLDIPPSPPGSPDPNFSKKVEHFYSLKKQGVHFNEKFAASSYLKNPGLLMKLMELAEMDSCAQYQTSLPVSIWDPLNLPSWGFHRQLLKDQKLIRESLEGEQRTKGRESIDFVPGKRE